MGMAWPIGRWPSTSTMMNANACFEPFRSMTIATMTNAINLFGCVLFTIFGVIHVAYTNGTVFGKTHVTLVRCVRDVKLVTQRIAGFIP